MRGDLSDIKTESDRQAESFGFYSVCLDLEHWAALTDVAAREAAMLLSLHNPRKESFEEAKTTRRPDMSEWHLEHLDRRLANYAAQNPRPCRSLRAWYSAAREMKIKLDPEAVSFMEHVARHMESDSTPAAAPVVAASASNPPLVAGGPDDGEAWKVKARDRANEIIKRQRERDLHPSQINIADEIAREFRESGIVGAGRKPLTGAYIKRHALKGISSAQNRQLSTSIRRGK
jgi:hypothetical protein